MSHGGEQGNGKRMEEMFKGQMASAAIGRVPILNQPTRSITDWDALEMDPVEDWVFGDFIDPGNTTSGGIFVAAKFRDTMLPLWRVRKVGPGRQNANGVLVPMNCQVGDVVVVDPTAGQVIELGTKKTQSTVFRSTCVVFRISNADALGLNVLKDVNTLDGR